MDLDAEPMVVSVPDMKGRYVVVQALNMWTDVFGSAGTRTNGGKAARWSPFPFTGTIDKLTFELEPQPQVAARC